MIHFEKISKGIICLVGNSESDSGSVDRTLLMRAYCCGYNAVDMLFIYASLCKFHLYVLKVEASF